jgi:hypothetical protein
MSGCSGCEQGTNGLCRYVGLKVQVLGATTTSYACYTTTKAAQLLKQSSAYFYAAALCSSPTTEGTLKGQSQTGALGKKRDALGGATIGAKKSSTVYSKKVKSGNVEFKDGGQSIDRTASTQPLGGLQGSGSRKRATGEIVAGANLDGLACENFNSPTTNNLIPTFEGCNSGYLSNAAAPNVAQQGCIQSLYGSWAAVLCPSYGVALIGFQQSLVDSIVQTCAAAGCLPTFPWDYYYDFQLVWPDDTAYALDSLAVVGVEGVTGEFEAANNFYVAADVQSARSGVEVVVVQAKNWTNSSMDISDAKWILSDPLAQQSVTRYFYPYLQMQDPSYCGFGEQKRNGEKRVIRESQPTFPTPGFAGTPGIVIQVSGVHFTNTTDSSVYIYAPYSYFEFTIAETVIANWYSDVGYFDPIGNFTSAPFLGIFYTPDSAMSSVEVSINGGTIGDPYYAPSQTYTTADEVTPFECIVDYYYEGKK